MGRGLFPILAIALLSGACSAHSPFPRSVAAGLAQIDSGTGRCQTEERYIHDDVYLKRRCAGAYPASLFSNGTEGRCLVHLDILPRRDGIIGKNKLAASRVECRVGRDTLDRERLGDLTPDEREIAAAMFQASSLVAVERSIIILEGHQAVEGRKNVIQPITFSLGGGKADITDTVYVSSFDSEGTVVS